MLVLQDGWSALQRSLLSELQWRRAVLGTVHLPCNLLANRAGGGNQNTESRDQEGQSTEGLTDAFSLTSNWGVFFHAGGILIRMHMWNVSRCTGVDAGGGRSTIPNPEAQMCHINQVRTELAV